MTKLDDAWKLTDARISELITQVEAVPCPETAYCPDTVSSVRFALHVVAHKALNCARTSHARKIP